MSLSRQSSTKSQRRNSVFEEISEYGQIITDLSRGRLKSDFAFEGRTSKLSCSLHKILFDEKSGELDYFVLFMDSMNASSYVKFLLDLKNFESVVKKKLEKDMADEHGHNQSKVLVSFRDVLSVLSRLRLRNRLPIVIVIDWKYFFGKTIVIVTIMANN